MTINVKAQISGSISASPDLANVVATIQNALAELSFAQGSGVGEADKVFVDTRTLAASTTEDLDLAGGSLTDIFGLPLTFVKVKAIMVIAAAGNTNNVNVGGDANGVAGIFGAVNDIQVVHPGGMYLWASPTGVTVTAGTGDIVQVANSSSGTPVTYSIIIIGASA